MPSEAPGMFGFLVTRLATHPENVATDALHYVLSTSAVAARALEEHLRRVVKDLPVGLQYDVQVTAEDGSIPDLAGIAADGSIPLLMEAKFYAGLTVNQPTGYLPRLPAGRPGLLLFVVPATRLELLWTEVAHRAGVTDTGPAAGNLRQAPVGAHHVLAMTSWRALLAILLDATVAGGDRAAAADLDQLRGLCDRMDSQAFHPLAPEELSGSVAVRLRQYTELVNKTVDRLIATGVATAGTTRFGRPGSRGGVEYWGRYFGMSDISCLLQVSIAPWARDRATPLWLQVGFDGTPPPAAAYAALGVMHGERARVFRRKGYVDVAIDLLPGAEEEAVLTHLVAQVRKVAALLPSLGAQAAGGLDPAGGTGDARDDLVAPEEADGEE